MTAKDQLAALVSNKTLIEAMDIAFEERRARLNTAIQQMDDDLGEVDTRVTDIIETFIKAMWREF